MTNCHAELVFLLVLNNYIRRYNSLGIDVVVLLNKIKKIASELRKAHLMFTAFNLFNRYCTQLEIGTLEAMHSSAQLQSPPLSALLFVHVIRLIINRKYAFFFELTGSDCQLTITTLIHWIKIDHDKIEGLLQNYCNFLYKMR